MIRATIWRDLRWRALGALVLALLPAGLVAASFALDRTVFGRGSLVAYLDLAWFRLPGGSAVFLPVAVIVGACGRMMRPRDELAYLLALPVSRRRWLLTHVRESMLALASLVLIVDLVFAAGAWRAGVALDVGALLLRSLGVLLAAGVWVLVTNCVLAIVRYPALAIAIVLGAVSMLPTGRFGLSMPAKSSAKMLSVWDPWAFADPRGWWGEIPAESMVSALVVGGVALGVALWRMERVEV